ncbi:hypothetical protein D047_3551B, partial [Vibrio parahaemolyticus VPTS-2010_2]
NKKARLADL